MVISHNKVTIEAANHLMGVTMHYCQYIAMTYKVNLVREINMKKVNEKFIRHLSHESVRDDLYISVMHADALEKALLLIELIKSKVKYKEIFLTTQNL